MDKIIDVFRFVRSGSSTLCRPLKSCDPRLTVCMVSPACDGRVSFTRDRLLHLYRPAGSLSADVDSRVRSLGLRLVCRFYCLHSGGRIGPVFSSSSSPPGLVVVCSYCHAGRARPSVERHSVRRTAGLAFGCINIRSLGNKLDDLLDVRRDHRIKLLFLTETWHDVDSVTMRRLRVEGYQVIDRPRPRERDDVITTNHGGVAAVAAPGVRLSRLDVGVDPTSFELLCVRVVSSSLSCVVAVIYRPGSAAISTAFFAEVTEVLDRLSTFIEPVYVVGDVNVHLERPDDP